MRDTRFDSFYFKGSKGIAVLLLHGYTGNPFEMRELGDYLHREEYTVYAPVYSGHGINNLRVFLNTKVSLWYDEALAGYDFLLEEGYEKIIVIGLSLGGAFTLRIGMDRSPYMIIPMSAPLFGFEKEHVYESSKHWVINSNDIIQKDKERYITIAAHQKIEMSEFYAFLEKKENLDTIQCPVMIVQGLKDGERFIGSAKRLDKDLKASHKLLTYSESSHVITMDKEKDKVFKDIVKNIKDNK